VKALVTGAAGFIGSHVARCLLEDGHEVVALDDLSGGHLENVPAGAKWIQGSITDYDMLIALFDEERFEYVYHFAAYAAEGLSHFIRRFNYTTNLLGSTNLINLSILHRLRCFVFTSSIAVYGSAQVPMTEDITPHPEDPYGISKYAVELDLEAARKQFGLDYIIFRAHNVYGENQNTGDLYRNVIGIFMRQILSDQPLTIFGDGEQTRAFSYIGDVAPVMAQAALNPRAYGEVFNIGADTSCTVIELARIVSEAMGVEFRKIHLPRRNEVKHAYAEHSKVRRFFDVPPATPIEDGIRRMAEWVQRVGVRSSMPIGPTEVPLGSLER